MGSAIIKKYYILFYFVDIKCSSVVVQYFIFLKVVDLDNIFLLTILIKVKCIYLLMSELFCFGKFVRNVLLQIYVYYFYFTVLALVYTFCWCVKTICISFIKKTLLIVFCEHLFSIDVLFVHFFGFSHANIKTYTNVIW